MFVLLLGYSLVRVLFCFVFLSVVLVCFLVLGAFVFVLGFCFVRKLKVGWVGRGEDLEELGGGGDYEPIYLNLKIILKT